MYNMPSMYPRHCKCCNYTANNAVLWSKHCQTIKHTNNSKVKENVNNILNVNDTNELLKIIQKQNETILKQNKLIMSYMKIEEPIEEEIDEINPFMDDIKENIILERIEQPKDNNKNLDEVLEHGITKDVVHSFITRPDEHSNKNPTSTLTNFIVKKISLMKDYETPIKIVDKQLYYKINDTWNTGTREEMETEINSLFHKFRTDTYNKYKDRLQPIDCVNFITGFIAGDNYDLFHKKLGIKDKDITIK